MKTITLPITNLHCVSCSLVIEEALIEKGVHARVNYAKQTVSCTFDEKKIPVDTIKTIVQKLGYCV